MSAPTGLSAPPLLDTSATSLRAVLAGPSVPPPPSTTATASSTVTPSRSSPRNTPTPAAPAATAAAQPDVKEASQVALGDGSPQLASCPAGTTRTWVKELPASLTP